MIVKCAWCKKQFDANEKDLMTVAHFAIAMGFKRKEYVCWPCWRKAHEPVIRRWRKHERIDKK